MKILLAIDGSEHSLEAINDITSQQLESNTRIKIVSAYQRVPLATRLEPMGVSEGYYAETDNLALKAAEDTIANAAETLHGENPSIAISAAAIEGSPQSVILDQADDFSADLIVVGSHGYGMVKRFLLGSVSHTVALHAKCSVRIVRTRNSDKVGLKVLLAIDGSQKSEAVVNKVSLRKFPAGSEVRVISVVEPTYSPSAYPVEGIYTSVYQAIEQSEKERASTAVENAVSKLRSCDVAERIIFSTKVPWGSAKHAILEQADAFGADLIFVGSHGHGFVERFLLGSVAQAVALHAKCSVEIVRNEATKTA